MTTLSSSKSPKSRSTSPVSKFIESSSSTTTSVSRPSSSDLTTNLNPNSTIKLLVGGKLFETTCRVLMDPKGGKENFLKTMALLHLQNGMKPRYYFDSIYGFLILSEMQDDAYIIKDIAPEPFML